MDLNWTNLTTCRICLKNNEKLKSFESYSDYSVVKYIIEINRTIAGHKNVPDKICENCLDELKLAHCFQMKCDESNEILLKHFSERSRKSLQTSVEGDVEKDEFVLSSLSKVLNSDLASLDYAPVLDVNKLFTEDAEVFSRLDAFVAPLHASIQGDSTPAVLERKLTKKLKRLVVCDYSQLKKLDGVAQSGNKTCSVCDYVAPYPSALTRHMRRHTEERPFKCDKCEKCFSDNSTLKKHRFSHDGVPQFTCHHCGKQFIFRTSLVKHLATHKQETFMCATCEKVFTSKLSLDVHTKRHTGSKSYVCELCGKARVSKYNLDMHMRVHFSSQQLKCSSCSYRTVSGACLRIHERTHSGDRPFSCLHCGEAFISGLQLARHAMKMHKHQLLVE